MLPSQKIQRYYNNTYVERTAMLPSQSINMKRQDSVRGENSAATVLLLINNAMIAAKRRTNPDADSSLKKYLNGFEIYWII